MLNNLIFLNIEITYVYSGTIATGTHPTSIYKVQKMDKIIIVLKEVDLRKRKKKIGEDNYGFLHVLKHE